MDLGLCAIMKLTSLSLQRLQESFNQYHVDSEYSGILVNYLIHALDPGSFFRSVLANDFVMALQHSHSCNTIPSLKNLSSWIRSSLPPLAWGSYHQVDAWLGMSDQERRASLEQQGLVYTTREEVWLILKNSSLQEVTS